MLGVNTKRNLITGEFARDIQSRVSRIAKSQLNENDKQEIEKARKVANEGKVIWIND